MPSSSVFSALALLFCLFPIGLGETSATAQGLIWKLPDPAEKVEALFEGEFTQKNLRAGTGQTATTLTWTKRITIRSLEQVQRDVGEPAKPTDCRWIEIEVITGKAGQEGAIEAGPIGTRIYRVCVIESAIVSAPQGDKVVDGSGVFAAYIPIVEGYALEENKVVKLTDPLAQPRDLYTVRRLRAKVLQVSPTISLVHHFRMMTNNGSELATVLDRDVDVYRLTGTRVIQGEQYRTTNTTTLIRCDDPEVAPFGVAGWEATLQIDEKQAIDPVTAFETGSSREMTEQMKIVNIRRGDDVRSAFALVDLPTGN